mgnify:CR=1 FL=1
MVSAYMVKIKIGKNNSVHPNLPNCSNECLPSTNMDLSDNVTNPEELNIVEDSSNNIHGHLQRDEDLVNMISLNTVSQSKRHSEEIFIEAISINDETVIANHEEKRIKVKDSIFPLF